MRRLALAWLLVGCGSASPPATAPAAAPDTAPAAAVPVDAAPPDAGVAPELATAPAWIFRYTGADRAETWTLRHHDGQALIDVERAQGTTRYVGSAVDGASLVVTVMAGTSGVQLDCKRVQQPIGAKCGDTRAKKLDVLDCYHRDFAAPMTFGPAPGVEFITTGGCNGYRLIPAPGAP